MDAIRPSRGAFSRHLSLVADMCIHFGVPVNAVLVELRRQLGLQIDAREGLSIAEASRLCDVSKKTISNWLKDARRIDPDHGDMVFSKIEFMGQVCDFCREDARSMREIQRRAADDCWRFGIEARELRKLLDEFAGIGLLRRRRDGRYEATSSRDGGFVEWHPPDELERYRQKARLLSLASSKTSHVPRTDRLRTTLHYQVADIEQTVRGVREQIDDELTADIRSWKPSGPRDEHEDARTMGILLAVAPTIPPSLNTMLADQERMNILNSACDATSPFPRAHRVNRVVYARFRCLRSGVRYVQERLIDVVNNRMSAGVDEAGEDWLGVVVAAVPVAPLNPETDS